MSGSKWWGTLKKQSQHREASGTSPGSASPVTCQLASLRGFLASRGLESSAELCDMLLAVFEASPDALFVKDRQGTYLLCNSAVGRLVGKSLEDILGQDDTALFDPASAAVVKARDQRVFETGRAEVEEEVLAASGQTRIYQAIKAPYRNGDGDLVGVIGISRDITESRQAQEALQQSERLLKLVLDALPVGVQVMDVNGDIVMSNPAAERIWGRIIGPAEQRYSAFTCRWHRSGEKLERADWASSRALAHGEVSQNELIDIETSLGTQRTILNSGAPLRDGENTIIGAVVINEDITERLRLENRFIQAQKMEAVGQLAAGTAHDFNNLLSIVSGYGELLLEDLGADHSSRELVSEILLASKKAATLTKQLLAFSSKTVLDPQILDLNLLVERNQGALGGIVGDGIAVKVELAEGPCTAKVDPVQFDQLLMSLCLNSRDAMPGGGTIIIRTAGPRDEDAQPTKGHEGLLRDLGDEVSRPSKGYVTVSVSDTGGGMSKEIQSRIFEPFFTTKSGGRGTGLGLSTVYGIMQQSGGYVEVESRPGAGTVFRLYLPFVEMATPVPEHYPGPASRGSGEETVLLVEDQDGVRAVLALALGRAGYRVLQASGGLEALRLWEETPGIDIVVTDVVMPEMSGRHLAERIRELDPNVKVLFMSGHTTDSALRDGVSPTALAWLQKPFTMELLTQTIREMLDHAEP